ncbi:MAG: Flp family type IVb pilin [Alphaproteobacteria bacterium]|nr:Flp family type IVb pilin [Alphaproteobacteria bacterium]
MFRKLFKKDSKGMTLIEYTLIISFIAFVIISALRVVGRGVSGTLNHLSNGFKNGEY